MSIEAAIHHRLINEVNVDSYPLLLPAGTTLPACRFQRVATAIEYSHDGDALLERQLWQFDLWATTYAEVCQLADTLRAAWSGYSAQVYEGPDLYIRSSMIQGRRDLYDSEIQAYRVSTDVAMWVQTIE